MLFDLSGLQHFVAGQAAVRGRPIAAPEELATIVNNGQGVRAAAENARYKRVHFLHSSKTQPSLLSTHQILRAPAIKKKNLQTNPRLPVFSRTRARTLSKSPTYPVQRQVR